MIRLKDRCEVLSSEDLPEDGHGNIIADWPAATGLLEPCQIEPQSSNENMSGQQTVISRWVCTLLASTTATAESKIRWRGDVYEVDGAVQTAVTRRGQAHHANCVLRLVGVT